MSILSSSVGKGFTDLRNLCSSKASRALVLVLLNVSPVSSILYLYSGGLLNNTMLVFDHRLLLLPREEIARVGFRTAIKYTILIWTIFLDFLFTTQAIPCKHNGLGVSNISPIAKIYKDFLAQNTRRMAVCNLASSCLSLHTAWHIFDVQGKLDADNHFHEKQPRLSFSIRSSVFDHKTKMYHSL